MEMDFESGMSKQVQFVKTDVSSSEFPGWFTSVSVCPFFYLQILHSHKFLKRFLLNIAIDDFNRKKIEIDQKRYIAIYLDGLA